MAIAPTGMGWAHWDGGLHVLFTEWVLHRQWVYR